MFSGALECREPGIVTTRRLPIVSGICEEQQSGQETDEDGDGRKRPHPDLAETVAGTWHLNRRDGCQYGEVRGEQFFAPLSH